MYSVMSSWIQKKNEGQTDSFAIKHPTSEKQRHALSPKPRELTLGWGAHLGWTAFSTSKHPL